MSIPRALREQIRQRANYACEFCGVSETDTGGELTIDHFQPITKGEDDHLDNLIYCCSRCNLYKLDYFPTSSSEDSVLWNPRREPFSKHFIALDNGKLHPLTPVGTFTISRLRLNRQPLVAYRVKHLQNKENVRLLNRYKELVQLQSQMNAQLAELTEEQHRLLEEQQRILKLLLGDTE